MIQTLNNEEIFFYLSTQLNNNFPDKYELKDLRFIISEALKKIEFNFSFISLPYYKNCNEVFFNHLNADHYTVFLYYCSSIAYKKNDITLASKFFYLNKILHSFHCMYDTELPDVFIVCHGVGVVLGKAKYSNYFVVTQGCTVGANAKSEYPQLEEFLVMYPNSSILGNSLISKTVIVSNNSSILNENINSNSLVVGQHPNVEIKNINLKVFSNFFKVQE